MSTALTVAFLAAVYAGLVVRVRLAARRARREACAWYVHRAAPALIGSALADRLGDRLSRRGA